MLEELYKAFKESGLADGSDPSYISISTPLNEQQGWRCTIIWAHHDGDIPEKLISGPSLEEAVAKMLTYIKENARQC